MFHVLITSKLNVINFGRVKIVHFFDFMIFEWPLKGKKAIKSEGNKSKDSSHNVSGNKFST